MKIVKHVTNSEENVIAKSTQCLERQHREIARY